MKKVILSPNAPKVVGPYSQAILTDAKFTMELSGQIGINPATGKLAEGLEAQTEQIFSNFKAILSEVGWSLEDVIKVRVYLVNIVDYGKVNEIYAKHFTKTCPARVALAVKDLPAGALIEIDMTAVGD
jgi:2-iminobutanoate/2-iminopropanoate deaminase